ncbi:MAG: DUF1223 domain-containing protein [Alphaproteobacteria bacterium]
MLRTRLCLFLTAGALVALAGLAHRNAAWSEPAAPDPARPVVVELFTSQSCYSCPPAEAYLGELAGRPGIVALEWHVDYWDNLVYGSAGQWRDPFSAAAHTARQVAYNQALRGTGGVYTPQMVIGGRAEAVGSARDDVEAAIAAAAGEARASLAVTAEAGGIAVALDGAAATPADVWLVRYLVRRTTAVERGENHGKDLTNHHVVTGLERLGGWSGGTARFTADRPAADEGCAVLVQPAGLAPVLAAAACPAMPAS